MPVKLHRQLALVSVIALAALLAGGDLLVVAASGSKAPSWSHWWCSPSAHGVAAHGGGVPKGVVLAALEPMRALGPHWLHVLPIAAALGTLIYLRRAAVRHRSLRGTRAA